MNRRIATKITSVQVADFVLLPLARDPFSCLRQGC
jgi:hypothetical protein